MALQNNDRDLACMSRNPRYDILFEPVRIGPVTAPNRFYQTPHAIGTGNQMPHTRAAMREVRAEGGWGVPVSIAKEWLTPSTK